MGQSQSIQTSLNQQNALIEEIHLVAQELSDTYSNHFLDPNFCNRLALIFNDHLLPYQKQDIDQVSYTLGLVSDVPAVKAKACQAIVKHYTDRLNLIAGIEASLGYVSDRIFALTTGPRCLNLPEVFDQEECQKSGGQWQPTVILPDQSLPENQTWFNYLSKLQSQYLGNLQRLLGLLDQLKRFDKDITDERLKTLGEEAKRIIDQMQKSAYELYKLILTTKTISPEEKKLVGEQDQIKKQEDKAKVAALRGANGLPATR